MARTADPDSRSPSVECPAQYINWGLLARAADRCWGISERLVSNRALHRLSFPRFPLSLFSLRSLSVKL